MATDVERVSSLKQRSLEEIAQRFGLTLVILFGSRAADLATEESDVDIAVQTECPDRVHDLGYYLDLAGDLSACLGLGETDVVFLDRADPLLKSQVARHGKVLFDKGGTFTDFAVRATKEFDDARYFHFRILKDVLEDSYEGAP